MNAQQRTLDDLKTGVNVQVDKGGNIRFRMQPQMGLPSIELIDKAEVESFLRVVRIAKDIDEDAYFSMEGGKHFLVDFDLINNLHEALKEVGQT